MIAILSDVHGNLDALDAVLDDARRQGAGALYCLGDVVGYGALPRECLDRAAAFQLTLLGNHDQAALFDPENFSDPAAAAIFWTPGVLESQEGARSERERRWEFLAELPRSSRQGRLLFVHGSPRNPLNEYVFPEDIYDARKMERLFALVDGACFQGHTHLPGAFVEYAPGRFTFSRPDELGHSYRLGGAKAMINVGSVGQPRDGDPRACYALLDGDRLHWRRVGYDVDAAAARIQAVPELPPWLGDRLRAGK